MDKRKGGAPVASLLEISRVIEEAARLLRQHVGFAERPSEGPGHPSLPREGEGRRPGPETDPRWIRSMLDLRRLRVEFLGFEASDAALAILITLYLARLEGRALYRTALALEACVPETTAFRVGQLLLDSGAVHRMADTEDKRLILLTLSDSAAIRMRTYLATAAALAPVLA